MYAKERQEIIVELIRKKGAVTTTDMMNLFELSSETIRKDFLVLERDGKLKRIYGGAVAKSEVVQFKELALRESDENSKKHEVAMNALQFIAEGDIISIDAGSTATIFAERIRERFRKLTVITNSRDVFNILSEEEGFAVILCGGQYMKNERLFAGNMTIDSVATLYIQKAFITPSALSLEFGISNFLEEVQAVQTQFIKSADKVFVLADSSKFEKRTMRKLCDMKTSFTYITDSDFSEELKELYKESGVTIVTGEENHGHSRWHNIPQLRQ